MKLILKRDNSKMKELLNLFYTNNISISKKKLFEF